MSTIDPPFIEPDPQPTTDLAKRIVRKSLRIKATRAVVIESGLSRLWDHLAGPVMKEMNAINRTLASAKSPSDAQQLERAKATFQQAMLTLQTLQNQVGAAQSAVRHSYSRGTVSPAAGPKSPRKR